ncbi:MAG: hypothetical protein LAT58_12280, partial [Opitutales bacterium]|nr:hypothetical protein [Opitutales bacterium]
MDSFVKVGVPPLGGLFFLFNPSVGDRIRHPPSKVLRLRLPSVPSLSHSEIPLSGDENPGCFF